MKRFANTFSHLCAAFCAALIFAPFGVFGQTATGPEQDCFGALPINRTLITQPIPYRGAGVNGNEITNGFGCVNTQETHSAWYRLNVGANGNLAFIITPLNSNDEYDFLVLRFPANAANQTAGCISALSSAGNLVACNFATGSGTTGLDNALSGPGGFNSFGAPLPVRQGEVYMLLVSTRTANGGFTLNFGASSPGVIPTTTTFPAPTLSLRANQQTGCGAANSLNLTFSEPILRNSVQAGTFTLTGPNNQTFSINSVACANCVMIDSNSRRGVSYNLNISPAISVSGTYTLALSSTSGAVALRNVDNGVLNIAPIPLIVNLGTNLPTVTSSEPIDSRNTTTFCLGKNVMLSTPDVGGGTQYQWFREGLNGVFVPVNGGNSRTLNVTGSYAFRETPSSDSTSVVILSRTVNFRVQVVDGNGCTRTSNPISVTVSPGLQARILQATTANTTTELRICRNEGITLEAQTGFRSYLWYFNNTAVDTARSRLFFARDAGTYAVETVDQNGCTNLSIAVVLNPRDVVIPVISGPSVNCADPTTNRVTQTVNLSVVPDSSYRTYQWFDDATKRPLPNATGNTVAVTTGTFFLTIQSVNGCPVTSAPFTVSTGTTPPRPIISGLAGGLTQAICPGGSFLLTGPEGFVRYIWAREGVVVQDSTIRTFIARQAGNYTVRVVSAQGCTSLPSDPPVRLDNAPSVSSVVTTNTGSLTTCRGVPLQLSIGIPDDLLPRATIEWTRAGQSGIFGTTRTVTVTEAGEYTVSVQFLNNSPCPVSSRVTVRVVENPDPRPLSLTGSNSFCQGGSLTLDAGDFATYQWFTVSGGVSTPIVGATMRTLVVRAAGSYSVRVTAGERCEATSAPVAITELPVPETPRIGTPNGTLLCPNGSLELVVENASPSFTYQWFLGNSPIQGATSSRLTITAIGSYTVEARSSNGCTSRPTSAAEITMATLPTPPVLPARIVICPNADTTITAPTGFMTYQWLQILGNVATPIMGETNRQFRISRPGLYSLRVSDLRGCINTSSTITVTQTMVVVTVDTIDAGVRFRARSTPQARLFQWLREGVNVPGATDSVFAPQSTGAYSVRVTDINGCQQISSAVRFEVPAPVPPPVCTTNCGPNQPSGAVAIARGDTALAAPGDTVIYNLRLRSFGTIRPGARIDATICFNATLLEPLPPLAAGTISGGVRCIPLTLTIPSDTSEALTRLPFRAALGNDSVTALVLTSRLSPGGAPLPTVASFFRLTTISYAGGARLIGPPPRMRLTPSRPNPVSGEGSISYVIENSIGDGRTPEEVNISISDVFGRTVQTIPVTELYGNTGEFSFSTADLSPGVYFVRVKTARGAVQVQKIHVVR